MTEIKFVVGTVVTLKSGGPKMTITDINLKSWKDDDKDMATCCWINDEKEDIYRSFPLDALTIIQE